MKIIVGISRQETGSNCLLSPSKKNDGTQFKIIIMKKFFVTTLVVCSAMSWPVMGQKQVTVTPAGNTKDRSITIDPAKGNSGSTNRINWWIKKVSEAERKAAEQQKSNNSNGNNSNGNGNNQPAQNQQGGNNSTPSQNKPANK